MKPTGQKVAEAAIRAIHTGYTYDEMDCQAFIEHCVSQSGGEMDYRGSNHIARNVEKLLPLNENTKSMLEPGVLLFIHEESDENLPSQYRGDGFGDFSHVGIYIGQDALTDRDKNGAYRRCDVAHSSASMGRTAGSTLANGWTHAGWAKEIEYANSETEAAETDDGLTIGIPENVSSYAFVLSGNGKPVKIRKSASQKEPIYWLVNNRARVKIERQKGKWALITAICSDGYARRGYMMSEYLKTE